MPARLDLNLRREPILALGATEGSSVVAVRCPTNKVKHHINNLRFPKKIIDNEIRGIAHGF